MSAIRQFRLRPSMVFLFIVIPLSSLVVLTLLTYTTTQGAINKTSQEMVERFNGEIIKNLQQTVDPVITLTRSAAALSENESAFFKKDNSWELLSVRLQMV